MLFYYSIAVLTTSLGAASALTRHAVCSESPKLICYGENDNTVAEAGGSQGLDPEHVQYVAAYLRWLSEANEGAAKFWTMARADDCTEWTLPVPNGGTVLALAKHTSPWLTSSVLYEDMATAIDGGKDAGAGGDKTLLRCGKQGGQVGVAANLKNLMYNTEEYKKSGAKPEGVLLKLVKAPPSKRWAKSRGALSDGSYQVCEMI
ncbi:hypothetical protein CRV24_005608 [Beauveria bassiana]|uniref:Ecp2 effector protein domain-containing protein n=1 Tax=Beauveria bassiana (strain ARSEF 2860) TaxID=655819 RepID=J5JZX5_BEAB2|nr:uncharacterized protein BBA_03411 [Beauveria bassiana ARSEF 2860]EJP67631.1 hypothetical protein BBA_03411 [Beauveria bassiana ARSEF 2860]KAF1734073.1 hypothetical protein CRV24_005608 [Beauveria bassiana]KAH8709436.1 hypothetical protein HC256_009356 [Beauveria bassiana]